MMQEPNEPRNYVRYLVAALVLAAAVFFAFIQPALAQEDNQVNPQQLPDSSFIYDTNITDLSTADFYFNNQTVQVVGEVVGDRIINVTDPKHCWIMLGASDLEKNATVSVYMSVDDSEKIDAYGKYGTTGTTLQVRGTFYLSCLEHEGNTDLHAEHVTVTKMGSSPAEKFDFKQFIPGIVAVVVGLVLMFVYWRKREQLR